MPSEIFSFHLFDLKTLALKEQLLHFLTYDLLRDLLKFRRECFDLRYLRGNDTMGEQDLTIKAGESTKMYQRDLWSLSLGRWAGVHVAIAYILHVVRRVYGLHRVRQR